jgi:hypothetical protein
MVNTRDPEEPREDFWNDRARERPASRISYQVLAGWLQCIKVNAAAGGGVDGFRALLENLIDHHFFDKHNGCSVGCERRFRSLLPFLLRRLAVVTKLHGKLQTGDIVEIDCPAGRLILRCRPRNDVDGDSTTSDNYLRLWEILRNDQQLFGELIRESKMTTSDDPAAGTWQAVVEDEVDPDAEDEGEDSEDESEDGNDDDGDGEGEDGDSEDGGGEDGDSDTVTCDIPVDLELILNSVTVTIPEKKWYALVEPSSADPDYPRLKRLYDFAVKIVHQKIAPKVFDDAHFYAYGDHTTQIESIHHYRLQCLENKVKHYEKNRWRMYLANLLWNEGPGIYIKLFEAVGFALSIYSQQGFLSLAKTVQARRKLNLTKARRVSLARRRQFVQMRMKKQAIDAYGYRTDKGDTSR